MSAPKFVRALSAKDDDDPIDHRSFTSFLEKVKPEIDARIVEVLAVWSSKEVEDLSRLLGQGKRTRAGIVLLSYEALSSDPIQRTVALNLATSIELAHGISLVIDDMLDGDEHRRGSITPHVINGYERTFLGTIGALSLPYEVASSYGKAYVAPLARAHRCMVLGAMREIASAKEEATLPVYDYLVAAKTGELFSLAARFGAMAAGADEGTVERFAFYGLHTGIAMQMADDISDLEHALLNRKHPSGTEGVLLRAVLMNEGSSSMKTPDDWTSPKSSLLLRDRLEEKLKLAEQLARGLPKMQPVECHLPRARAIFDLLESAPRDIAMIMLARF